MDENMRSGIKDLLDANRETPVVDIDTAIVLEYLLLQMNQGTSGRLALPLSSAQMNESVIATKVTPGTIALSLLMMAALMYNVNGPMVDSRWTVPYDPYLSAKFDCLLGHLLRNPQVCE